jgi:ribonuclease HI
MKDVKSEIRNPKSENDPRFTIYSDGGSRGNPGPAACGVVIFNGDKEIKRLNKTIGNTTNNQAEYQALEMGLNWIKLNCYADIALCDEGSKISCKLDSELVVKQLNGEYKIKNVELKPWFAKIRNLVIELGGGVTFSHIRREQNKIADMLVNEALDREQA